MALQDKGDGSAGGTRNQCIAGRRRRRVKPVGQFGGKGGFGCRGGVKVHVEAFVLHRREGGDPEMPERCGSEPSDVERG
jgi:hypothetical protein